MNKSKHLERLINVLTGGMKAGIFMGFAGFGLTILISLFYLVFHHWLAGNYYIFNWLEVTIAMGVIGSVVLLLSFALSFIFSAVYDKNMNE